MSTYFRILKAIIRENKKQTAFCFGIMLDLNNLKTANDTMGHSAGDRI